jgi:acyl carrier protein
MFNPFKIFRRAKSEKNQSTEERVFAVVKELFGLEESRTTDRYCRLKDDLQFDELDMVELTMYIEDEFSLEISDEDVHKWIKINDIINYVEDIERVNK